MRTIYKYPIEFETLEVELPIYHHIVYVEDQNGVPTIWIELNPDEKEEKRKFIFRVIGTGQEIPEYSYHIGSCKAGIFVWHIYQEGY